MVVPADQYEREDTEEVWPNQILMMEKSKQILEASQMRTRWWMTRTTMTMKQTQRKQKQRKMKMNKIRPEEKSLIGAL